MSLSDVEIHTLIGTIDQNIIEKLRELVDLSNELNETTIGNVSTMQIRCNEIIKLVTEIYALTEVTNTLSDCF